MLFTANGQKYVVKFIYFGRDSVNVPGPTTIANCFLFDERDKPQDRPIVASGWSVCAPSDMPRYNKAVGRYYAFKRMVRAAYENGQVPKTQEFAMNAFRALREQTKTPAPPKVR